MTPVNFIESALTVGTRRRCHQEEPVRRDGEAHRLRTASTDWGDQPEGGKRPESAGKTKPTEQKVVLGRKTAHEKDIVEN